MFDIDQDVEILALIQAAHQLIYNTDLTDARLRQNLHKAIHKLEETYGKEIFTYDGN